MKASTILGIIIFLILGCIVILARISQPVIIPISSPIIPKELENLPKIAWVKEGRSIWEKPGLAPLDPDSYTGGNRGRRLGAVEGDIRNGELSPVELLKYQWSGYDEVFYIYMRYQDIEGWVSMHLITFNKPD